MNENIISREELSFIMKFIDINQDLFKNNGTLPNRKYLNLPKEPDTPKLFFDIKERILDKENIRNDYIDHSAYEDYVGYITDGGKIHQHKDPTIDGYDHVRFNLFLSVPRKGGFPVYDGVSIPVKIGDYVRCNSSKDFHECEVVEGDVPRIVISYGIYLKRKKDRFMSYQ
jgi:hypothetical protein